MGLLAGLLQKSKQLKSNVYTLYRGMHDPRVPWYVKLFTLLVIAYVISPIDIIPDFIPVLGLLDEVILVPLALSLIMCLMPEEVIRDYQGDQQEIKSGGLRITGIIIVVIIWLLLIVTAYMLWGCLYPEINL